MVEVGFPVLWAPFLTSQGQSYSAFAAYYQGVATAVRQAGLKLVVENDTDKIGRLASIRERIPLIPVVAGVSDMKKQVEENARSDGVKRRQSPAKDVVAPRRRGERRSLATTLR